MNVRGLIAASLQTVQTHSRHGTMATNVVLLLLPALALGQERAAAPKGIEGEQDLPSRYGYVAQDAIRLCQPQKGFWIDLGAGKGEVAMALIHAADNPVVMLDPDKEAMASGLQAAREQGLQHRLFAVVGTAEALPFPDNVADLIVSRGSIFFWQDPVLGLKEVLRVLHPGGKAFIGGGAGSGYPKADVAKLIRQRKEKMQGDEAEKWKRFVELRRPEQMRKWAQDAALPRFEVLGQGAISDDPQIGQGVWLVFEKPAPPSATDQKTVETAKGK